MLRFTVLVASLALSSPGAEAKNPVLAADLAGQYWAYNEYCEGRTEQLRADEAAKLSRIAVALGFSNNDKAVYDLALDRRDAYRKLWQHTGLDENCRLTLVYLRGLTN